MPAGRYLVVVHAGAATHGDLAGLDLTGKLALLDVPAQNDLAQLHVTYASYGAPALGSPGPARSSRFRLWNVTPCEWELNSIRWVCVEQSRQARQIYRAFRYHVVEWHKAVVGPWSRRIPRDIGR